ncbi:MAG: hypothetical protein GY762_11675 [Proteobacteria bacterium]|nr:hypothetical protein [Pseudomonadota bacterium]
MREFKGGLPVLRKIERIADFSVRSAILNSIHEYNKPQFLKCRNMICDNYEISGWLLLG